jgi:hypothetical protein
MKDHLTHARKYLLEFEDAIWSTSNWKGIICCAAMLPIMPYWRRREIVEHPFGSIKQWMNQGAFLMRGLEKVRAEFSLTALAYNMTRVLSIVGIERLLARGAEGAQSGSFFATKVLFC